MRFPNLLLICVLIIIVDASFAQELLYKNDKFSLYRDRVIEGEVDAYQWGDSSIGSGYRKEFEDGFDRTIIFKFSVNGFDNEKAPGEDYRFELGEPGVPDSTPVYTFGEKDKYYRYTEKKEINAKRGFRWDITFRVNMQQVLESFRKYGSHTFYNGSTIKKEDFTGVYIMGSSEPLNWDFPGPSKDAKFRLSDNDGDGIYEITLQFVKVLVRGANVNYIRYINVQDNFPQLETPIPLLSSLYKMSAEEFKANIKGEGTLMAGAKWTGVWTRDISYSILLSLAIVAPDACKTSLMAKVKDGMIIQDTGTGGSWPVSSDRIVWALAAYEVYLSTGDAVWLKESYDIIKRSIEADEITVMDPLTGLFRGETSFLDWREQTYPRWMEPADIYKSCALGTNVVFARTYQILAEMEKLLGISGGEYAKKAENVKTAINTELWNPKIKSYSSFIYGRNFLSRAPVTETMGASIAVLFDIAGNRADDALAQLQTSYFGTPVVSPQQKNIPPYHNNGIWPFVEAYKMWAAKENGQSEILQHSMASILRASALFLTNKENMVAETGSPVGTEINSDRQLWSVAGNLAISYRVLFGIRLAPGSISFAPYIPSPYAGTYTLKNLKVGKAMFNLTVAGSGNNITEFLVNGKKQKNFSVRTDSETSYQIQITLGGNEKNTAFAPGSVIFAPEPPDVKHENGNLHWESIDGAEYYHIYKNGKFFSTVADNVYEISVDAPAEYQVCAVSYDGIESFLSAPVRTGGGSLEISFKSLMSIQTEYFEPEMSLSEAAEFTVSAAKQGNYAIDFLYANGSGPINTDNKCAIRSLDVNGKFAGTIVMPQRGMGDWSSKGYTNSSRVTLSEGNNTFRIYYTVHNQNMNGAENRAHLYSIRLTPLSDE